MKTPEEILSGKPKKEGKHIGQLPHYHHNIVISAMNEYSSQFKLSQELKEYIEVKIEDDLSFAKEMTSTSKNKFNRKVSQLSIETYERFINELKTL